ncbi:MAG TPA: TMEM175 family protein [Amycolatopsis sp.]|nr:TMEM175 family protein [Amycolatopsis sp.]
MNTSKSPERLIFFSDAVIAIALTLLVLPLTETVPELVAENGEAIEAITKHQWQIYTFLLSFAVIARLWINHHRIFEQVGAYNRPLMAVNLCWLFTIALLPFPTEMVGAFSNDQFAALFYIGTILASSLCQTIIVLIVHHDDTVKKGADSINARWLFISIGSTLAVLVAFVLAALVPVVSYLALLLLVVPSAIARLRYGKQSPAEDTAELTGPAV